MNESENHTVKVKKKPILIKTLPVKLIQGKSMDEKLSHAKAVSASIKDFKEAK